MEAGKFKDEAAEFARLVNMETMKSETLEVV